MAEENAAPQVEEVSVEKPAKKSQPVMLIGLVVVNIFAILAIGYFVYKSNMAEKNKPSVDEIINSELKDPTAEPEKSNLIPLETFLVNLSGTRGRKLVKINMELDVSGEGSQAEIENLKPKIRDMIIIILSSKSYSQVSTQEGKDDLRAEIRNQVNLFLTKGQIDQVFFTEFIYN